jgi:hypothetical protein
MESSIKEAGGGLLATFSESFLLVLARNKSLEWSCVKARVRAA